MIRVVLIDGLTLIRAGIRTLLQTTRDITVVAEGATADDASALVTEVRPDVLLLDRAVPGAEQAIRVVKDRVPTCEVIVLTNLLHQVDAARITAAGASGYVGKDIPAPALIAVLRAVCDKAAAQRADPSGNGAAHVFQMSGAGLHGPSAVNGLTARELDILIELTSGGTDQEIAAKLLVGEGTVKTHVRHILHKLGVPNRTAAIAYALRQRLIE